MNYVIKVPKLEENGSLIWFRRDVHVHTTSALLLSPRVYTGPRCKKALASPYLVQPCGPILRRGATEHRPFSGHSKTTPSFMSDDLGILGASADHQGSTFR